MISNATFTRLSKRPQEVNQSQASAQATRRMFADYKNELNPECHIAYKANTLKKNGKAKLQKYLAEGFIIYRAANNKAQKAQAKYGADPATYKEPKNISRGNDKDLNGELNDRDGELIECRQLAFDALGQGRGTRISHSSLAHLQKNQFLMKNNYDKHRLLRKADSYLISSIKDTDFGNAVFSLAKNMAMGDKILFNFNSENHALRFELSYKQSGVIELLYSDPNRTAEVIVLLFKDKESLKNLQLSYIIPPTYLAAYFPTLKDGVLAIYNNPREDFAKKPYAQNSVSINSPEGVPYPPTAAHLYYALEYNSAEIVEKYFDKVIPNLISSNKLANAPILDEKKLLDLFLAEDQTGAPGLYLAIDKGCIIAIHAYLEGIIKLVSAIKIDEKALLELVVAKRQSDNTDGLSLAFLDGNEVIIDTYFNFIMQLALLNKLSDSSVKRLLDIRSSIGYSGVGIAFCDGHAKAIQAYITWVKNFITTGKLKPETAISLFEACEINNNISKPGLFLALENNHVEVVNVYLQFLHYMVGIGILNAEDAYKLFAAKTSAGDSALSAAIKNKHADVIKAYFQGIKDLPAPLLASLLIAPSANGTPGLAQAFQNRDIPVIRAYLDEVVELALADKLDSTTVTYLLASRVLNQGNISGLSFAVYNGDAEAIAVYLEAVNKLFTAGKLTLEQVNELLITPMSQIPGPGMPNAYSIG